jgi:hypothetical protein
MNEKVAGALFGAAIGFVFAWAWLSDPAVIRDMLLLREADVYLLMGSAIAVGFIGSRLLRRFQFRALVTGESAGRRSAQRRATSPAAFSSAPAGRSPAPAPARLP